MLFKVSIIGAIASFAAVSQSFVIPRDSEAATVDGHYGAELKADGTIGEPVLITALAGRSENPAAVLKSRSLPNPQIGCPGYSMDKNAYGNAYNWLGDWCNKGNWIQPNYATWWTSGSTIAYICNYGGWNPCSSNEFYDANILIDANCGTPNAGWVLVNDWAKGYGRDNKGVNICSWGAYTGKVKI